ncbi:hypothetical protein SPI_03721 [Niveomyces insectorum RCEF 264]|uniref:Uncharacterized protein n=1 Tax=Niveomyces insectorum RCEF 264 TaxID=1081102 RepID=A0A167WAX6_9HYPO|nr:hypothetical protein SPI_03721 [Niveomyces insectorum RCEF 264]
MPSLDGIVCLRCQVRLLHPLARRPFRFPLRSAASGLRRRHVSSNAARAEAGRHVPLAPLEDAAPSRHVAATETRPSVDDTTTTSTTTTTAEPADAEAIWDALLDENVDPTEEEVSGYIDELRPADETIVPRSEFVRRAKMLADGFTVAQLQAYVRTHRTPARSQPTVHAWELQRAPWVPDVPAETKKPRGRTSTGAAAASMPAGTTTTTTNSPLLHGYVQKSMSSKEKLVVELMRECWGLAMQELVAAPGHVDVTVRELEFALLAAGAQTWLQAISAAFSTRVLRVFAPTATADAILAEIDAVLRRATTRRFPLSGVVRTPAAVGPTTLQALGQLTGSWVRLDKPAATADADDPDASDVLVSWIAHVGADKTPPREDTADRVFRLLLRAYGPATAATTAALDYQPLKRSKARFLADVDEAIPAAWSWEHRQGHWARWVEPALAASSENQARRVANTFSMHAVPMPFTSVAPSPETETSAANDGSSNSQKWYRRPWTSTVATFGRVLHAQPGAQLGLLHRLGDGADGSAAAALSLLHQFARILSPVVPPLLGIDLAPRGNTAATSTTQPPPAVTSTAILLRFLPDPNTPLADCAPPLEVFLDVPTASTLTAAATATATTPPSPSPRPALTALHTIMATHVSDCLFPTRPVDVRVTQQRFFALPGADVATTAATAAGTTGTTTTDPASATDIAPLLAFLDQSQLRLGTGQPLATPLRLRQLGLPKSVLLAVEEEGTAKRRAKARHDTVTLDYVFAGLEVRRRVATAFGGWTLALTSVETGGGGGGGRAGAVGATSEGGRWTDLALEAVPAAGAVQTGDDGQMPQRRHDKASFQHAVGQLLHGDHLKWVLPPREIAV